ARIAGGYKAALRKGKLVVWSRRRTRRSLKKGLTSLQQTNPLVIQKALDGLGTQPIIMTQHEGDQRSDAPRATPPLKLALCRQRDPLQRRGGRFPSQPNEKFRPALKILGATSTPPATPIVESLENGRQVLFKPSDSGSQRLAERKAAEGLPDIDRVY